MPWLKSNLKSQHVNLGFWKKSDCSAAHRAHPREKERAGCTAMHGLQLRVPPVLRASGDNPAAHVQRGRKFSAYFLSWPGSVPLHFAAGHRWHCTLHGSLQDLLWHGEAILGDLGLPACVPLM